MKNTESSSAQSGLGKCLSNLCCGGYTISELYYGHIKRITQAKNRARKSNGDQGKYPFVYLNRRYVDLHVEKILRIS